MCKIEFRGKCSVSERWIYGYYAKVNNAHCIFDGTTKSIVDIGTVPNLRTVSGKTVGMYSGRDDKNGTKIYQGDIIEYYDFTSAYKNKVVSEVVFLNGVFGIMSAYSNKPTPLHFNEDFAERKTTVIGNVFDNPNLIGDK